MFSSRRGYLSFFGIAVLLTSVLAACDRGGQQKADQVEIGVALPLTGDSASWGEKARDAVQMAVDQRNAARVGGAPLYRLTFEDSKGDAAGGSAAIRALFEKVDPAAVIAGITSGETAAMIPLADKRRVPLVSPTASADSLSGASPYFFRLWPADSFETDAFAKYLVAKGVRDVAVLYIQNEYGDGVRNVFASVFPKAGGRISTTEGYSPTATSFRPILARLAQAGVKNVYIAGYYKDAALILTQARDIGAKMSFFGTTTVGDPQIVRLAGKAADGLIFSELQSFDPGNATSDLARRFISQFQGRYHRAPGWAEAHGFDSALVILDAVDHGARTPEAIRAHLASLRGLAGVTGAIRFDAKGNIQGRQIAIKSIKDGRISVIAVVGR